MNNQIEFDCPDLDSTVDIYVMQVLPIPEQEWVINARWGNLQGKPRVLIFFNFETRKGFMTRDNYPN